MGEDYIEIHYTELNQLSVNKLGFAKINFNDLNSIAKFTARSVSNFDPLSDNIEIEEFENDKNRFYQRLTNDGRTHNIQQYIIGEAIKEFKHKNRLSDKTSLGVFPTSIILAINSYQCENIEEYNRDYIDKELAEENQITLAYHEDGKFYLPKNKELALIVDGQHRIAALRDLYSKINEDLKYGRKKVKELVEEKFFNFLKNKILNFEFTCTILINFDLYEQGEIFASVNFNQKPVNRSLYFDIFGSSPNTEKNELKLSHDLVRNLNFNDNSVLKNKIDMLGDGNGIVSQSSIMGLLIKLFSKKKCWHMVYMDYRNEGIMYKSLGLFLRLYFAQIKTSFSKYWPEEGVNKRKDYKHILIKTTGIGAFTRLIDDIYTDINPDHDKSKEELEEALKDLFLKIENHEEEYFSKKSPFVQSAGLGLQSKLYKKIAYDLGYRDSED